MNTEIKCVKTTDFEMEYFCFGSGKRPFVIIPGVSLQSIMPQADNIVAGFADFAEHYTVYVFDRKRGICSEYPVEAMAADTAEAMKRIGIADADIFGASEGGMIAMSIAVQQPELVHALYIASSLARQNETSDATIGEWMRLAAGDDIRALNHGVFIKIYSPEYYEQYKDIFASMEGLGTPEEMKRFYYLVKAAHDFDIYDKLDMIKCPAFSVGSKRDAVLGMGAADIAEKLGCTLHMYDGYGHGCYDEAPDFRPTMLKDLLSVK